VRLSPQPSRAKMSLANLPRALRISATTPITRNHVLALYKEQLTVAQSFSSYNFREYFVRRTKDRFRSELPSLLDAAYSSSSIEGSAALKALATDAGGDGVGSVISSNSTASTSTPDLLSTTPESTESAESIYAPTTTATSSSIALGTTPEDRLREWYGATLDELAIMTRAAFVNRMYEGPKLVVEGRIISGGEAGQK
jgi:hypothetical protein